MSCNALQVWNLCLQQAAAAASEQGEQGTASPGWWEESDSAAGEIETTLNGFVFFIK